MSKVRTCLWLNHDAKAAATFYVSLLPNSGIDAVIRPDPAGPAFIVEFTLAGAPFMLLNGGPTFTLTPAASISVTTADQIETDRLWHALIADGGAPSQCGWLTDRFGVSWQIVPAALSRMLASGDRAAAARAQGAMLKMRRIDIAAVEAAFKGERSGWPGA